jgi:putative hydrolase of the HAD superfamily
MSNFKSDIRNIVFDLGGVLLDLDFTAPVKAFRSLGIEAGSLDYRKAIADPVFTLFETGMIPPGEFRDQVRKILNNSTVTDTEIDAAWCAMLLSVPESKVALLKTLGKHFRLFLFSNTNAIHIAYFREKFEIQHGIPIESLFEKLFYSHKIHDRKPLLSAFDKVTLAAGILPGESLFIDDFEQNILTAGDAGYHVLHYIPGTDLAELIYKELTI